MSTEERKVVWSLPLLKENNDQGATVVKDTKLIGMDVETFQ